MTDEEKKNNEDAISSYQFEELFFFLDTDNGRISPLTAKEEMFEKEFITYSSRDNIPSYVKEILATMKHYRLPYVIKTMQGTDKSSPDLLVTTIYSKEDHTKLMSTLRKKDK